jgi:hypothetical protein
MANRPKPYLRRYKSLSERQETMFIYLCVSMHAPGSGSVPGIPKTDPNPGEPNPCGSMLIRIHNSGPLLLNLKRRLLGRRFQQYRYGILVQVPAAVPGGPGQQPEEAQLTALCGEGPAG